MNNKPDEQSVVSIAYRAAGHAVMAYLIVKAGIEDSTFALPVAERDRELMVPDFDVVAANDELSKLYQPTMSLRSLLTVPLFIFAGFAAQRIYEDPSMPSVEGKSKAEGRARGLMYAYWEEYDRDVSGPDSKIAQFVEDRNELAYQTIRDHWGAVELVAQRLLEDGELSREEVFVLVEHHSRRMIETPIRIAGWKATKSYYVIHATMMPH